MTEDGVVDPAARGTGLARRLQGEIRDRVVKQDDFYDHLNKTVFIPVLGIELSRRAIKDIIGGLADQFSFVALAGGKVRFGSIGVFLSHITPPGPRWDPNSKTSFQGGEKVKLAFRASRSSKRVFAAVAEKK